MKQKYILLTMILFVFFFLFFATSLALIPGDFGSANGGPPDGVVDFEDLMIFAMAYGSTPTDDNWNSLCDIASQGSTTPDGVIDFEDLMVFALHYGEQEQATWTVMVYLDGDNSLDDNAWVDLSEMESIGSSDEINIITQVDLYNSCSGTYRYFVTGAEKGSTYPLYSNDKVQTLPEQNMADPAVLNNFINWGINNYPADHYILILWDHGGGWREESIFIKGIIVDETSNDILTMAELVQGLENIEEPLDIIGFDACLMQMVEVYYEIGSSITSPSPPRYGIGSEESELGNGWPYDLILGDLTSNPSMSESTLCEIIVNDYIYNCGSVATLSALYFSPEITQSTEILNAIDSFANALMNSAYQTEINSARLSAQSYSNSDYKDLYDFAQKIKDNVPDSDCQSKAQAVMDLINSVIVAEGHTGPDMDNSHGLSIYLPDNAGEYDSDYSTLGFATDTQWDEFLQYNNSSINPPSVTTLPADNITSTSARLNGSIDDTGGEEPFDGGFEWRLKSGGLDIKEEKYGVGDYYTDVTGLTPETTYEFRIWAENSAGRTYGSYLEFTTDIASSIVQRALLVGVGDYLIGDVNDLSAPPYDVNKMHDTLSHSGDGFALINELKDLQATKSAILNGIASTFGEADADDISYFYFTGHGLSDEGISYLCPTDVPYYSSLGDFISVNDLESALSAIPGTKVVFLDSCHSGGFIGKEIDQRDLIDYPKSFNDNVINIFMTRDLTNSQYQVLTACLSTQTSLGIIPSEGDPFGLFSAILCESCGYDYYSHPYDADANENGEITLDESYNYTDEQVNIIIDMLNAPPYEWGVDQDTQVYPENSNFVIIEE